MLDKKILIQIIRNKALILFVATASYFLHVNTLVSWYRYYILIIILSVIAYFLWCFLQKERKYSILSWGITCLYSYFMFFSICFVLSINKEIVIYETPLNGITTNRSTKIYFDFDNTRFSRNHYIMDYGSYEDLPKTHKVVLYLKQSIPHFFVIDDIYLDEKIDN